MSGWSPKLILLKPVCSPWRGVVAEFPEVVAPNSFMPSEMRIDGALIPERSAPSQTSDSAGCRAERWRC